MKNWEGAGGNGIPFESLKRGVGGSAARFRLETTLSAEWAHQWQWAASIGVDAHEWNWLLAAHLEGLIGEGS